MNQVISQTGKTITTKWKKKELETNVANPEFIKRKSDWKKAWMAAFITSFAMGVVA